MIKEIDSHTVVYSGAIMENECRGAFPLRVDLEELLAKHRVKYGDLIRVPNWKEPILALPEDIPEGEIDPRNLRLSLTTSYEVQAKKNGAEVPISACTVVGLVKTYDGNLVFGIRGGELQAGHSNIVPGGHVTTHPWENPIFASYSSERHDELGIIELNLDKPELIGHQRVGGKVCFVMRDTAFYTDGELKVKHARAFEVYADAKAFGRNELDSRKAIGDAGYANVDAWENTGLIFVPDQRKILLDLAEAGAIKHEGREYRMIENVSGALRIYCEAMPE